MTTMLNEFLCHIAEILCCFPKKTELQKYKRTGSYADFVAKFEALQTRFFKVRNITQSFVRSKIGVIVFDLDREEKLFNTKFYQLTSK